MTNTMDNIFERIFQKIEAMPAEELSDLLEENQDCGGLTVNEFLQDHVVHKNWAVHQVDIPEPALYSGCYTVDGAIDSSFEL